MKKITLLLLSLLFAVFVFAQENPYQGRIEAAFGQSFATQQNQLESIIQELKEEGTTTAYWVAYAQFYSGIYYQQSGQNDQAAQAINEAVQRLQSIENRNSEEHALLGYLLGISIAFDPSAAGRLSAKAAGEYKAALKKDDHNLRAYLGVGISDFHTPVEYGGGKKVEEYLLKAISLPEQSMENGPSWGKNMAYHTLASFYKREGKTDKAKMYCMQGLSKYPNDMQLNQLKQSF